MGSGLAAALSLAIVLAPVSQAGKGKEKDDTPKPFEETLQVNAPIPNESPAIAPSVPVRSEIRVGRKYKGEQVGDLNILDVTTFGSSDGAAGDLQMKLTGPTGRTLYFFTNVGGGDEGGTAEGANIGPLTFDDESPVSLCKRPNCSDPQRAVYPPFQGTVNLIGAGTGETGPLGVFDGLKMRGIWMLTVWDNDDPTTSTLFQWGLRIKPAKHEEEDEEEEEKKK